MLILGLAACQPVPQPFAHRSGSDSHVIEPPMEIGGIAVLPVSGAPDAASRALADALAEALTEHEIPAARGGGNRRSKFVQGTATTRPAADSRIAVDIAWDLFDGSGTVLATRRHAGTLPVEDWQGAGQAAMRSLTRGVAAEFATLINGPPDETATAAAALPLHVWPVDGGPAGDDALLQQAMEAALRRRDFAVTPGLDGARLIVAGALSLGPVEAGQRPIEITWSVLDTYGHELGKLTQRNAVPTAALTSGWKALATVIAESAAGGVGDLLRRLPPDALRTAPAGGK